MRHLFFVSVPVTVIRPHKNAKGNLEHTVLSRHRMMLFFQASRPPHYWIKHCVNSDKFKFSNKTGIGIHCTSNAFQLHQLYTTAINVAYDYNYSKRGTCDRLMSFTRCGLLAAKRGVGDAFY